MSDQNTKVYTGEKNTFLANTTHAGNGLSTEQVSSLRAHYGKNQLDKQKKRSLFVRFLLQFQDVMVIILIIAAAVSYIIHLYENEGLFEPLLILAIVVANAIIGVIQEGKAEKALESLKRLSAPQARVVRDGHEQKVDASDLVPGDIIKLEAGDFVPADARLIEAASLQSEESALTGESMAVEKDSDALVDSEAAIGDRINMVHSGCSITYGRGVAIVTSIGMQTEMGKVAGLLAGEKGGLTPLQQKLSRLGVYLGIIALISCAIIFAVGVIEGMAVMEIFMIAVSLAVSAIPEGLPAIVTIVLAIGVRRMVKKNAIIRKLPAVETLGSASIICSDKTGTLTQNRMTLVKVYTVNGQVTEAISDANSDEAQKVLRYATLCSDGRIEVDENNKMRHIGDPTETAIVYAAYQNGIHKAELEAHYPRVTEVPFDSNRKLMTTVHKIDGKTIAITKGAYDSFEGRSDKNVYESLRQTVDAMGADALRVLTVGYQVVADDGAINPDGLEKDITLLGLVGMIDPPREEAREAVALCRQAGIKPVMITGDHVITASAVAKQLDILRDEDNAITGADLKSMSDDDLQQRVASIAVYARVSPEDKIRIVKAWQVRGEVVAMTGDGVNDAPALKAADIGCAMGVTGTDVAKGAADMTLTDDNFATIVTAVKEGRGIYANITKVVRYLLGTNTSEIITVLAAMVLWHQTPVLAAQLLWINLVSDGLPAIALGMEPVEEDVMKQRPKRRTESLFAGGMVYRILLAGLVFGVLTLASFYIGWQYGGSVEIGQTMAFITLAMTQILQSLNVRSERSLFKVGLFSNRYLTGAVICSIALVLAVVFVPPIAAAFGLATLSFSWYGVAFGLSITPLILAEAQKLLFQKSVI